MGNKRKKRLNQNDNKKNIEPYLVYFKPLNEKQEYLFNSIFENTLTIAIGPPGTAKTYVSCAAALKALQAFNKIKKIYLVKSVTTLQGEDIGFLKGGVDQKMAPFTFSFRHNFEKIIGKKHTDLFFENKIIEVLPMAYMRGISLSNAIVIFDEAQNVDAFNMRTLMTRIGKDCKLIVLGDTKQIDLKNRSLSVLEKIFNVTKNLQNTGHVKFTNTEIVRSQLVQDIDNLFEKHFPNS